MIWLSKVAAIAINSHNKSERHSAQSARVRIHPIKNIAHSPAVILLLNVICWSNLLLRLYKIYKNRLA